MPGPMLNDGETIAKFRSYVQPLAETLNGLVEFVSGERERRQGLWAADSPMMREVNQQGAFAGEWGQRPVENAYSGALLLVIAAEDLIGAMCRLALMDEATVFGYVVLARAALEHAARAFWLLEPGIEPKLRIARHQTQRIASFAELKRLPPDSIDRGLMKERLDEIYAEANRLGFRRISQKGKPTHVEEPMPSATSLVRDLMRGPDGDPWGGTLYSIWSATAHGTLYSLQTSLDSMDEPDTHALRVSSDEVNLVLAGVITGYMALVQRYRPQLGWADDRWDKLRVGAAASVRNFTQPYLARSDSAGITEL